MSKLNEIFKPIRQRNILTKDQQEKYMKFLLMIKNSLVVIDYFSMFKHTGIKIMISFQEELFKNG